MMPTTKVQSRVVMAALLLLFTAYSGCAWGKVAGGGGERPVAFLAQADGFWQLFVINEEGTGLRQITRSPVDKVHVSWSLEQDKVLVNTNQGKFLIVDLATDEEKNLDIGMKGMTDAVWSQDGKKILFSISIANSIDANDIWLVDIATRKRKKLTGMKEMQHDPVWSNDGRQIVFLSGAGGQSHDLWRLSLETGNARQLTVGQLYHFEPACSVKDEIAFSSNRTGDYEIWACDLEGKKFEQITHSPGLDAQPTWSPDGKKIAFVSTRSGRSAIWMVNRDGSNPRQLTPAHMLCRSPAWSR
jgi:TolB protein